MANPSPEQPRSSFGLAHLVVVGFLALGAGAGTAWLLTDGGTPRMAVRMERPVEAGPPRVVARPTPTVTAPVLATPSETDVMQPAPLARRELALAPAAVPIPIPAPPPAPRGSSGTSSSDAVQLNYGQDERALAPAAPAPSAAPAPAQVGDCERYTTEIVIDGRRMQRTGTACLQSDGTWRMKGS